MVKISLFSQMLSLIPRDKFERLVSKHGSDKHQKGISSWTHLVAMLFCHIGGAASVRDISNGLTSTTGNLSHLGIDRVPSKSSMSYINKIRTPELFKAVYFMLLEHLSGTHKFSRSGLSRLKRKIFLADASIIPLCLKVFDWASYRSQKGAIKLHTVLDYDGLLPVFVKLTDAKTHEIKVAKEMCFPKGSVVVVDRGYLDFSWLKVLDSRGCFFVTRAKSNMAYEVKEQYDVESGVLQDEDIYLTSYASKKEYGSLLRRVVYLDSTTGKQYVFLTNNRHWDAQTVADIYKERWAIEVFFKQIKSHMKIKSFVGTSKNAVLIQIWTAMIAMLLLKYLKEKAAYDWHLSNLVTFIRLNLFVKIELMKWLNNPFYKPTRHAERGQLRIGYG
jgi:hypothetical protein